MRTWITPVLLTAVAGWLAHAQQPKDPPPIIITPKKSGGLPGTTPTPKDPPGVIVIRPKRPDAPVLPVLPTPGSPAQPVPANPPLPATVIRPQPAQPGVPAAKDGRSVFDYWFVAAVEGKRIGYLHWTAREIDKDGKKLWIGTKYQKFTVARFGQAVAQFAEESTVELPGGDVLVTSLRQGLGTNQMLALTGVVEGDTLKVTGQGVAEQAAKKVPWPGGVTGVAGEPRLFARKAFKPGESFEYLTYVGQVNRVVKITTTFEAEESLVLWPNTPPKKLLRFVSRMTPVGNFKLPPSTVRCDAETIEPMLVEFNFAGLGGRVTFLRTTEAGATAPVTDPIELFNAQSIHLDREIPGIHSKGAVVYKVSIPGDDDPGTVFATDTRQEVKHLDPKSRTFELHVVARHGPVAGAKAEPAPGKEFLGSSYFINWDNDLVKGHAARAVAGLPAGATAWDKARAIERWVNRNMRAFEFSQAMATADSVAKTLSGDCTEYAMLAAAMCRAVGVPSRTVLGLVYAPPKDGTRPFLAYHMWYEVYADGQWLPLDATLGLGGVGPGHVKITDASWHEEKSLAPLLPVLRVLTAKPAVEVLRVTP